MAVVLATAVARDSAQASAPSAGLVATGRQCGQVSANLGMRESANSCAWAASQNHKHCRGLIMWNILPSSGDDEGLLCKCCWGSAAHGLVTLKAAKAKWSVYELKDLEFKALVRERTTTKDTNATSTAKNLHLLIRTTLTPTPLPTAKPAPDTKEEAWQKTHTFNPTPSRAWEADEAAADAADGADAGARAAMAAALVALHPQLPQTPAPPPPTPYATSVPVDDDDADPSDGDSEYNILAAPTLMPTPHNYLALKAEIGEVEYEMMEAESESADAAKLEFEAEIGSLERTQHMTFEEAEKKAVEVETKQFGLYNGVDYGQNEQEEDEKDETDHDPRYNVLGEEDAIATNAPTPAPPTPVPTPHAWLQMHADLEHIERDMMQVQHMSHTEATRLVHAEVQSFRRTKGLSMTQAATKTAQVEEIDMTKLVGPEKYKAIHDAVGLVMAQLAHSKIGKSSAYKESAAPTIAPNSGHQVILRPFHGICPTGHLKKCKSTGDCTCVPGFFARNPKATDFPKLAVAKHAPADHEKCPPHSTKVCDDTVPKGTSTRCLCVRIPATAAPAIAVHHSATNSTVAANKCAPQAGMRFQRDVEGPRLCPMNTGEHYGPNTWVCDDCCKEYIASALECKACIVDNPGCITDVRPGFIPAAPTHPPAEAKAPPPPAKLAPPPPKLRKPMHWWKFPDTQSCCECTQKNKLWQKVCQGVCQRQHVRGVCRACVKAYKLDEAQQLFGSDVKTSECGSQCCV